MSERSNCAACGAENPTDARFCMACGSPLQRRCTACGATSPPQARFCIACGAALEGSIDGAPGQAGTAGQQGAAGGTETAAAPAPPRIPDAPSEQRRTVTVLFADLSGYTAVAERLDPEALKALVDRCLRRLAAEVDRYGGRVDKYIGDNVMAIFGAPVAHEDDAQRAVRAALGMQAAMEELNLRLRTDHGFEFALRVGVNTGEVLAGSVGDAYTVIGDAVNVAARLQAAASPGAIVVGERTRRAAGEAIEWSALEPLQLKGKAEPVAAWEALGLRSGDPDARRSRRGTPLVGRVEELAALQGLVDRVARNGASHLVTVFGQAGVGKSRLLRELELLLTRRDPPVTTRRGRCPAFGASIVYWPLGEVLRDECGIAESDSAETARAKLFARVGTALGESDGQPSRRLAPLARLLGIEGPVEADGEVEDPQSARESFFGTVRAYLEEAAQDQPLVLAWEDIHWADDGMLDLIEYLSRWLRAPVLQVCLSRDELLERRPQWGASRRGTSVMFLDPLSAEETRELVGALLRDAHASPDALASLADRAAGNPLFAEEMVQRMVEQGAASVADLPETVQGLLAARLDSLAPFERELVSHAAVIGRTFSQEALLPVAVAGGGDLQAALARLREKDIIIPSRLAEQELAFKHVLIRDVAYAMLPKAVRARKHEDVGSFIEHRAGERGEEVVALLAEHFSRAAALGQELHLPEEELQPLNEKALRYVEAAGDAASALYANGEALAHYETAAALAGDTAARARVLEKQGDVALRLGRVEPALEVWQRSMEFFEGQQDNERVAELHRKIGAALAHKGERREAIAHHQKGINLIKDAPPSLALVRLYEEAAWLYAQTGDNMLAIYASEKALRLAEQLDAVRAASRAHGIFGMVFGRIGDTVKARENLDRAVALARESDAGETVLALLALGNHLENAEADASAAADAYGEALEIAQRIGDVPAQIELHAALAQLAFHRCDWEEVLRSSDTSAELAENEGLVGKLCLPYVLRGVLRWRSGDWDASSDFFRRARELAERIGWTEVVHSALIGLAATLRDRGEAAEADAAVAEALEVSERAGLAAQSIQAMSLRAGLLSALGEMDRARELADRASAMAEQVRYPVCRAAALEAQGLTGEAPGAIEQLREARATWQGLGRPLDAARVQLLFGQRLQEVDGAAAEAALADAAAQFDRLGVGHLAARARALVAVR